MDILVIAYYNPAPSFTVDIIVGILILIFIFYILAQNIV
jgi:hypothetical protein